MKSIQYPWLPDEKTITTSGKWFSTPLGDKWFEEHHVLYRRDYSQFETCSVSSCPNYSNFFVATYSRLLGDWITYCFCVTCARKIFGSRKQFTGIKARDGVS